MNEPRGLAVDIRRSPEPPSVLMVGNFLSGTGGRRGVCEDLAERLREAGWSVRTTSRRAGRLQRLLEMLGAVWSLRREYEVAQVDVFSGPAFVWAASTVAFLRALGKPCVLCLRGGSLPAFASRWPRLVRWVLSRADLVTAPSAYLAREMSASRDDIVELPNPLDLMRYRFALRSRPHPRLIWLRAFHEVYNPVLATEVLALLVRDFPDAVLTMVGPDKGDGSVARTRAAAARLGVSARLRIIEGVPKEQVGAVLAEGDVFLNTTNVDNFPVTVAEAMACGLCVVSTNVGGMPDLASNGEDAILVPPRDAKAMAAAIGSLLRDPELSSRLSRRARQKAEGFDWSVILAEWERILRRAAHAEAGV